MKILTNMQLSDMGGIEVQMRGLTKALLRIDPKVLFYGIDFGDYKNDTREKVDDNLLVLKKRFDKNIYKQALLSASLNHFKEREDLVSACSEYIEEVRPDIILINGTYYFPWALLSASLMFDIPIIHSYHGILRLETDHYGDSKKRIFNQMEDEFSTDRIFKYIFPSYHAKKVVEESIFNKDISNYKIVGNGVDIKIKPSKKNVAPFSVAIIGRWSKVKNIKYAYKLKEIDNKRFDILDIKIVTNIKKDDPDFECLDSNFSLMGQMNQRDLLNFISQTSIVISPSEFETFGSIALESLYCGTPVLINNTMGIKEFFFKEGLSDMVIDFNDTELVYRKIIDYSGKRISPKSKERIMKDCSFEIMGSKYLDIFKEALNNEK